MLTAEGCAARRTRLWNALSGPCDALIVADPAHLIYLANFVLDPFSFRTNEAAGLLLLEPGLATLVADDMVGPPLERALADEVAGPTWYDGDASAPYRRGRLLANFVDRLSGVAGTRFGVELAAVPAGVVEALRSARPGLELLDIGPTLRELRRFKDPDELAVLRRSMRAGEAAHAAALERIEPGMTELDAYGLVQNAAQAKLGERAIVYGDFVSGPRTWRDKGGAPSSRVIERGDLILLDFSVIVDGYRGDFTNTFAVGAPASPRQRELFDACHAALRAGEAALTPGTPAREVDAAVRGRFAALGLAESFVHHTGHGIGLGHPEPPYLTPHASETLEAGDVVTLEPGLYVDGVGGMRIERNYVITKGGHETLSRHDIRIDQRP